MAWGPPSSCSCESPSELRRRGDDTSPPQSHRCLVTLVVGFPFRPVVPPLVAPAPALVKAAPARVTAASTLVASARRLVLEDRRVRQTARVDISARVDYAVRAMLILADADAEGSGPVSVDTLSTRQELPRKFLEAIFADLRRSELVLSRRGARGGYVLGRPRGEISVGEIFRAVDGPLAEVRGLRPHETEYQGVAMHLPSLWVAVRASLREVLDGTSIEDLRTGDLPDRVRQLLTAPDAWRNR